MARPSGSQRSGRMGSLDYSPSLRRSQGFLRQHAIIPAMDTEIRIAAEVSKENPDICKFSVDRVVLQEGCARFGSKEAAQGAPLAAQLFELPQVAAVDLYGRTVMVRKNSADSWRTIGPLIGTAIRAHLRTGQPAVTPELMRNRPAEEKL